MKMVGFEIHKKPSRLIFVCPPTASELAKIESIEMPFKRKIEGIKVPIEDISLEMNLRKMEEKKMFLMELEEKLQKEGIMGFKENAENANKLLDEAIINIILAFSKKDKG